MNTDNDYKQSYSLISKYKGEIMGFAAICVILTHSNGFKFSGKIGYAVLRIFQQGSNGVDVFLYLSAMGLYYSMKNSPIINVVSLCDFYKRRIKRILPSYLL
jgi:peptidoglycan/LPS O-acetylase OafA/YrhL